MLSINSRWAARVKGVIVSAHMDDFKAAGTTEELEWLRGILRANFGDNVKVNIEQKFIHTGICHQVIAADQKEVNFKIVISQDEYAAALRPVEHESMIGKSEEEKLEGLLYS